MLLRLLKLRLVVNGHYIYALVRNKPIVIDMPTNPSKLVVTDGFHITPALTLTYTPRKKHYFKIVCAIEDGQLLAGLVLVFILYAMGFTSGIFFLEFLSIIPFLYFIFLYYIKRKEFIRIQPL